MAGLNEHGYRTDAGYQILSVRFFAKAFNTPPVPPEVEHPEEQPRPINAVWNPKLNMFTTATKEDQALLDLLMASGYTMVEAIVGGKEKGETELLVRKEKWEE